MSDAREPRVIGRLRLADGSERPVYEGEDGRMYVKAGDGSPVYGVWLPPAFQPLGGPVRAGEAGPPPWEQPGAVRRDGQPHRGDTLLSLGRTSSRLGALSFVLPVLIPCAFILGTVIGVTADCDLARMKNGVMDPTGKKVVSEAKRAAERGIIFAALALGAWLCVPFFLMCGLALLAGGH